MVVVNGKRKKSQSDSSVKKIRPRKAVNGSRVSKSNSLKKTSPTTASSTSMILMPPVPPLPPTGDDGSTSSDDDELGDTPSFLLIPLLTGPKEVPEISLENALDYPIGNGPKSKLKPSLKLLTTKKRSPISLKLEKAREELEQYNKDNFALDVKKLPLKDQVLLMDIDVSMKSMIVRKFEDQEKSRNSFDQTKFNNWVKDVLQLPFGKRIPLPITLQDGPEKIGQYLLDARKQLDKAIAGQDTAKEEVIDFIARLVSNPNSRGNILALSGCKGSGKTRLIRKGVAEALKRPFHVINLGGMNDVHVLTGHDLTYTGAKYGRLAQILMQSQCENPVVYLDEIDKVQSGSDKGMEIFRVLTHVLDEEQNHEFFDEYFSGIKLDLSKILFVASLNNPDDIDPILRDRLKMIPVKELDLDTKVNIVYNYIMPELCSEVAMDISTVNIPNEVCKYVIQSKTENEQGCRQLKRKLETIVQKLNTQRITDTGYFNSVEKKVTLTRDIVDELLKNTDSEERRPVHMYG
jgi:ATP-dependent Lon protease